jgi:hypothetical protein
MSLTAPYRMLLDELCPEHDRLAGLPVPALGPRALATLRHSVLDRRLADGESTTHARELTVRAWQITRPGARERLATALDAILLEAERPREGRSAAVRVCREEVDVSRSEIIRLAARLREARPVQPRGVALLRGLLTDGTGPLYVWCPNDELYRRLRRAALALG